MANNQFKVLQNDTYKDGTKQTRNELEIMILEPNKKLEDVFTYVHEISDTTIYEENTGTSTEKQLVLKSQYVKDDSTLVNVLLTTANKLTYMREIGAGGSGGSGSPANLALGTATATTQPITNSNGTGVTLPSATTTAAGLLSAADKVILDGLATGVGESALIGDGTTPAIPTPNLANWKLNTVYVFNTNATIPALTLADGTVITTVEAGSSLKMVKTGASTYAYTLNDAIDKGALPTFVKVPISLDFNTITAGGVYPTFGAGSTDFTTLPANERFILEDLKAIYKPIEIQARLVNSTATPLTFDFSVGGTAIPAINISYSATLVSYPIPVLNQTPTNFAKVQIGTSTNALTNALEAYVIYQIV